MKISVDEKYNLRRLVLLCVVGTLATSAVSNQRYWIDEITCKRIAASGSWSEFAESLNSESGSDDQIPVFQTAMFRLLLIDYRGLMASSSSDRSIAPETAAAQGFQTIFVP